eukprot:GFUD01132355.1.p1 GENE.GFUD01132355.1~~GFUD01132355.1.p1  ORF type:complete len:249 (+),score=48.75 GFUD01132355.1:48-794(+)
MGESERGCKATETMVDNISTLYGPRRTEEKPKFQFGGLLFISKCLVEYSRPLSLCTKAVFSRAGATLIYLNVSEHVDVNDLRPSTMPSFCSPIERILSLSNLSNFQNFEGTRPGPAANIGFWLPEPPWTLDMDILCVVVRGAWRRLVERVTTSRETGKLKVSHGLTEASLAVLDSGQPVHQGPGLPDEAPWGSCQDGTVQAVPAGVPSEGGQQVLGGAWEEQFGVAVHHGHRESQGGAAGSRRGGRFL